MPRSNWWPTRRFVHSLDGVTPPAGRLGAVEWVLSRALCVFRVFDLSGFPAGERRSGLGVRLMQWSPYADTGYCFVWQDAQALVWAWDQALVTEERQRRKLSKGRVVPETLLYPKPAVDGPRLLKCVDGYDGQYWVDGELRQSHWWPGLPTVAQWSRFLRSCSLPASGGFPDVFEAALTREPWGRIQRDGQVGAVALNRRAVAWGLGLLVAWLAWQGGSYWRWSQAVDGVESEVARLTAQLDPILAAESDAKTGLHWLELLSGLHSDVRQVKLLSDVLFNANAASPLVLLDWQYANGELKLTLSGKGLEPSDLVKAYEAIPQFHDVSARTGFFPDSMEIRLAVSEVTR